MPNLVNIEITVHLAPLHREALDNPPTHFETAFPSRAINLAIVDETEPQITIEGGKVICVWTICVETSLPPLTALEAYQKNGWIDWDGNGDDFESVFFTSSIIL
jgi:hypothetical protein